MKKSLGYLFERDGGKIAGAAPSAEGRRGRYIYYIFDSVLALGRQKIINKTLGAY